MYEELVKRLWECASGECFNCSQYTPTTNASVCQKELMKQAADAIEELSKPRWISVEERLPGYGEKCLVAFKLIGHNHWSIQVSYCYVQKEGFWSDCGRDYKAVAWCPLPEPPKEG